MPAEDLTLRMRAQGARAASRDVDRVGKSTRNLGNQVDRTGRKSKRAYGSVRLFSGGLRPMMGLATGAAGALGIMGLAGAAKTAISEFRDAQKASKTTAAGIKSIGAGSWTSTKHVENLASAIGVKSAIDDETVQSGANLLLTFGKVRNEVGKGNNVFDRATQAAVDLSARGFGSVSGTAKQMGKALNDPVKGISALGRAGVTFTESQKKQIETLVKTGKTLDAQKIILREVEAQVGGTAAAQADPIEKAQFAWNELMELLGAQLWPIIGRLSTTFGTFITQVAAGTGQGGRFRDVVMQNVQRLVALWGWISRNRTVLLALGGAVLAGVAAWKAYMIVMRVMAALRAGLVVLTMWRMGTISVTGAQWAMNAALIANPIGLVVVAIAALVAGLVIAYKRSETFRTIVGGVFNFIREVAAGAFDVITFGIRQMLTGIGKVAGVAKNIPGLGFLGAVEKGALGAAGALSDVSEFIRGGDEKKPGSSAPRRGPPPGAVGARGGAVGRKPVGPVPTAGAGAGSAVGGMFPSKLESNTTLNLDGKTVAKNTQRHAIKKKSTR